MKGSFACVRRVRIAVVLAICISENSPLLHARAADAVTQMKGSPLSTAAWTPRAKRSPSTEPIEPPMKSNSKAATTAGSLRIVPRMTTSASVSPVAVVASCRRAG
jgi:hypothetical protein